MGEAATTPCKEVSYAPKVLSFTALCVLCRLHLVMAPCSGQCDLPSFWCQLTFGPWAQSSTALGSLRSFQFDKDNPRTRPKVGVRNALTVPAARYVPCKRHRGGPCWTFSDRGLLRLARQSKRPEAGIEGAILHTYRQPRQDASRSAPVRMADEWYAWNLERATALDVCDGHVVCNTPLWAPLAHSDSVRQALAQASTKLQRAPISMCCAS